MATVSGAVEAVSTKFGKFGVLIGGKWYNTKPEWLTETPNKGDMVEFDDGGRNYIKKLVIKSSGGGEAPTSGGSSHSSSPRSGGGRTFPVAPTAPERTINRQNALTNAVNFANLNKDTGYSPEDILEVARIFEAYTTGDLDVLEAEAAMQAMEG